MPLDILVPFWGELAMLRQTVDSVLAQTDDDWLLTVIDDDYPGTEVAEYFAGIDDPRVRYVRNETNVGITENFRRCVRAATQERIAVVGCDDILLPNYVEVVRAAHAAHPTVDIIQPGVQVIDETGTARTTLVDVVKQRVVRPRTRGRRIVGGEPLATSLLTGDWLYWPSLAMRRERLLEVDFRDGFPIIQDLALVIDLVASGSSVLIDTTVCFGYRRHSESASAVRLVDGSRFEGERAYFDVAARLMTDLGWKRAAFAARARVTSRAHALTLLPKVLLARDARGAKVLARHAFLP
ncbi:glycosyltransferase [Sanguibacter sp. 25GB23B1]|uniref:glycosyltransferase family 2 protein n=1 Tax=unclassified Sanguibacter TaxID=2645534 RepID=UPI0032AEEFEB